MSQIHPITYTQPHFKFDYYNNIQIMCLHEYVKFDLKVAHLPTLMFVITESLKQECRK